MQFMYRTIDLCAGIGGIRKGFERTGHFKNVLSAEIDEYAARTYQHLFGDDPRNDLTSVEFKKKVADTRYDVLLAGFPCQPFSSVGSLEGFKDPTKGTIFFHIKQMIQKSRPKVVFLENVQNIVSHDNGNTIHVIIDSLEKKLDYKVVGVEYDEEGDFVFEHSSFVRNTKDFGLPQNRPRAYFIAFDRKLYGDLLNAIDNSLPGELPAELANDEKLGKSLAQIIQPKVDIHYYMSFDYLETLKRHKAKQLEKGNGYGYCILNQFGAFRNNANTILATGGSGKERNLIIQKMPRASAKKIAALKKKGGLNKENVRIMTPTEWGRLQGFIDYAFVNRLTGVDEFEFPDNMPEGQKYKQFGNSVSIPVIETMAYYICDVLQALNENKRAILFNYQNNYGPVTVDTVKRCFDISTRRAQAILDNMLAEGMAEEYILENNVAYRINME